MNVADHQDDLQQLLGQLAHEQILAARRDMADDREARIQQYHETQRQLAEDASYLGMKARLLFKYRSLDEAEDAFYEREADATLFQHAGT